ncbi:YveK family protein [Weissella sp. MSCH1]|uniref:YveK family protein n=1 Tax=Weissella sp. MSCH1 TaxID=3383343 RepID=UPI0038969451
MMKNNEYSILDLFKVITKNWLILILVPIIVMIVGFFCIKQFENTNVTYKSQAQMLITSKETKLNSKASDVTNPTGTIRADRAEQQMFLVELSETLKDLTTSDVLLSNVAQSIYKVEQNSKNTRNNIVPSLMSKVKFNQEKESYMFTITGVGSTGEDAAELANTVSKALIAKSEQYWGVDTLKVISRAVPGNAPERMSTLMALVIPFVAGLILTIAGVFMRDSKLRTKE